ncbi:hypothetical protein QFC22_003623 [Naganishia vaughanmartiniae]|uniref:Uncharacterized protein n=1 Tax=Naganishia vaughanmartiniae TaxID=1424756 RepID=A0ACC2X8N3_9TREE|nr:hypothetical protein QFC22_003623 [Naganishia vaughanmartiniae]
MLQPLHGYSLEHKTSATSIRSLLNDPVEDPRQALRNPRPSNERQQYSPPKEQRQSSPQNTSRGADHVSRFPSHAPPHSGPPLSRFAGQDRKVSRGSEGSSSYDSANGMDRPVSAVSGASSRFDYPYPTSSTSTSSMACQQAYHQAAPPIAPDMYSTMPSKAIQTNGSSRAPISRATKACNACRSRKVRCDAGGPKSSAAGEELACTRCKDSNVACVYTGSQRKRGPAPGANRPNARRKPSSLELELEPEVAMGGMGLGVAHDMSRTRSASSITSANSHYHPYAPVKTLPSPPLAYRGMPHSAKHQQQHPGYPSENTQHDFSRPQQMGYERPFSGTSRGPISAPLSGRAEFEYRHSTLSSADSPYRGSPVAGAPHGGYMPHDQPSRHPPAPHGGIIPDHLRPRATYPDVDPALQQEPSRPSTGLSGWQGGEPPKSASGNRLPPPPPPVSSAGPPPPPVAGEQDRAGPPRAVEAAAYQAGYEAALREARISAKLEVQREEQDRRERERLVLLESETRLGVQAGQAQQQHRQHVDRRYPDLTSSRRGSYWEHPYDARDPVREEHREREREWEREREREREREMSMRSSVRGGREHHFGGEMDTRVTLPPIQQMDH